MSMETEKKYTEWGHGGRRKCIFRRVLAILLVLGLILNPLEISSLSTYAADNDTVTFEIGEKVTAVLTDGVLTLTGEGTTNDYNAGETPFLPYAENIHTLVIGQGITYIGAYLFYGLGSIGGELVLTGSIAGVGEGAFSGDSLETAPKFTMIRNEFESALVTSREEQIETPQQEEMTQESEEPVVETKPEDGSAAVGEVKSEAEVAAGEEVDAEQSGIEQREEELPDPETEIITQQEIANPAGLFFAGQKGSVYASDANTTFIQAAQSAGYLRADGSIMVTMDDVAEIEVPTMNGQISLPECPEEISSTYADDALFDYTFEGWNQGQPDQTLPVLAAGSLMDVWEEQNISLYSVWNTVAKYQLQVKVKMTNGVAAYTLIDAGTGEQADGVEGYDFQYQWQVAKRTDGDAKEWTDIEGANGSTYDRMVENSDTEKQFRCAVTAVRQTKIRAAEESVMLYSEETAGVAVEEKVVYVDQTNGDDAAGNGTAEKPYATIEKAGEDLKTKNDGGTIDNNKIVIVGSYELEGADLLRSSAVPVTITGATTDAMFYTKIKSNQESTIELYEDVCFEKISLKDVQHIYGNGYNTTIGTGVTGNGLYLYGGGSNSALNGIGEVTALSGNITRIVGTVRSQSMTDVQNREINITVGGTASVDRIVVGCASGAVKNANAFVNIEGGTVRQLVGGNQGFNNSEASFEGNVTINVSGGKVTNILGSGEGRNVSVPTFLGHIQVNVSGGTVDNIYGAGSAAYMISGNTTKSKVNITATGGVIGNIYGAGSGGDSNVKFDKTYTSFPAGVLPGNFGSVTGEVEINIEGEARITGNIYASGEGYYKAAYDTTANAYLNGNATITIAGGTVEGNVYGGGKGSTEGAYNLCARVTKESITKVMVNGGTVKGNIFGGGQNGLVQSNTSVDISGGTINGNIYGGGESGLVEGKTEVNLSGGTIYGSVYGGALGKTKEWLVYNGTTVNMTGGWVWRNLYGGSELSNDGPEEDGTPSEDLLDLGFVNLAGGTVSGNVFGGGYQGVVNGSTHLHIGKDALEECKYYQKHESEKPSLADLSPLIVEGSAYAGGDYGGGDTIDYTMITVKGTSHVYIDGTGYNTGNGSSGNNMIISGGVFGSGASCDAGSTRLVTLKNYGQRLQDDTGIVNGASRSLTAIQRADQVTLINSHVHLTGQSDIANSNQTAKYSLNRIGDHDDSSLGADDRGVILQGGSTLVIDSAGSETSSLRNIDDKGENVTLGNLEKTPNTILFNTGTVLRFAYTKSDGTESYGAVKGYAYMLAADIADAYTYARKKDAGTNSEDGGFKSPLSTEGEELEYTNIKDTGYRYWKVSGKNANADRHTVLTAQTLKSGEAGYHGDGYSTAAGTIELPPSEAGVKYTIQSVILPSGLTLADAAKNGADSEWELIEDSVDLEKQKEAMAASPLDTFGLFMNTGEGFTDEDSSSGKIISNTTSTSGTNSIIGQTTPSATNGSIPKLNFCLTYWNDGITASKDLGTIQVVLKSDTGALVTMSIKIITKASTLTDQSVDLYATQSGSYVGKVIIPSGYSRRLQLAGVEKGSSQLVSADTSFEGYEFSVEMQTISSQGWTSMGEMKTLYDLNGHSKVSAIGTTDSRYQAEMEFTLKNSPGFQAKPEQDKIILTLKDQEDGTESKITLNIHWEDSIVSGVSVERGRSYDHSLVSVDECKITPKSTVTGVFTLGNLVASDTLWLELRNEKTQEIIDIPVGTKLTLVESSKFYYYGVDVSGDQFLIDDFINMSTGIIHGNMNLGQGAELSVIVDFGKVENTLPAGKYSLRLRSNTGADSKGAEFTVDSSQESTAGMSGGDGASRGVHNFQLSVSANSDTRFMDGAAVVLSPDEGSLFPAGTVFTYDEKEYYPSGGKVYIPLTGDAGSGEYSIKMDTTKTAGLVAGDQVLKAELFPVGINSGARAEAIQTVTIKYKVTDNPAYSLKVELEGDSRIVEKGSQPKFIAHYSIPTGEINSRIGVIIQKKTEDKYEDITAWNISGNTKLSGGESSQKITVSVPSDVEAGTYRLVFTLGDQRVPYNMIVR